MEIQAREFSSADTVGGQLARDVYVGSSGRVHSPDVSLRKHCLQNSCNRESFGSTLPIDPGGRVLPPKEFE